MNTGIDPRLLKFGIVGISGMFIDFGITWVCKEKLSINKYIANAAGFTVAVTSNFILNRNWTFAQHGPGITPQFFKFLLVSLSGLVINTFFLYLFVKKAKLNFYLSKLIVIGIVFFWNYFFSLFFTFI